MSEESKTVCPITNITCTESECELWYDGAKCCSLVVIADSLRHIAILLERGEKK